MLGAAGGIGQPLGLLLKMNKDVAKLALYDIKGTPGVAADLSHIDTRAQVLYLYANYYILYNLVQVPLYLYDFS